MSDQRLLDAVQKTGEWKVASAFKQSTFVYGTQGGGSFIVRGLKNWAARPRRPHAGADAQAGPERIRRLVERELNLYDPGRRAALYISGAHQMMDLYYGQKGTDLHTRRVPAIAEFMHYAMGFHGEFSMKQSGREAYLERFKTTVEGWDNNSPSRQAYDGLTATKEMSRIIRWGIHRFGGRIIFEGRDVYYSQVFKPFPPRLGDTDVEARELFQYFTPGRSTVPFGKGTITFHWSGREVIPTRLHFITNWTWADGKTHLFANMIHYSQDSSFLPIWKNFLRVPPALAAEPAESVAKALEST
jgi:hypothetical protein